MQSEFEFGVPTQLPRVAERQLAPVRRRLIRREPQLVLPGYEIRRLHKLFFAVCPDEAAADHTHETALAARDEAGLAGQPLGGRRYHISLQGLGEFDGVPNALVDQAIEAARSVAMPAFTVCFDRLASFGGGAVVLRPGRGVADLRELHWRLGEAMKSVGLGKRVRRSFEPHATLLYDAGLISERTIRPLIWTVRSFLLIHSPQGLSQHNRLGRWECRG
jgi:2'-5' RNA ligase